MLRSRSILAAPAPTIQKILRLRLLAPAPGHFQKPINQKFKVMIFFIKNEKKWMIVLRGQNKNLKETWIRYHILKNLLVMEVFLLDNYRSRSRKRIFFSAPTPAPAKNYSSGSATLLFIYEWKSLDPSLVLKTEFCGFFQKFWRIF